MTCYPPERGKSRSSMAATVEFWMAAISTLATGRVTSQPA